MLSSGGTKRSMKLEGWGSGGGLRGQVGLSGGASLEPLREERRRKRFCFLSDSSWATTTVDNNPRAP